MKVLIAYASILMVVLSGSVAVNLITAEPSKADTVEQLGQYTPPTTIGGPKRGGRGGTGGR